MKTSRHNPRHWGFTDEIEHVIDLREKHGDAFALAYCRREEKRTDRVSYNRAIITRRIEAIIGHVAPVLGHEAIAVPETVSEDI